MPHVKHPYLLGNSLPRYTCFVLFILMLISAKWSHADVVRWQDEFTKADSTNPNVIALWQFDQGSEPKESSGNKHDGTLRGAKFSSSGKFGGCLESTNSSPDLGTAHSFQVKHHPNLTLTGSFSIEMWLKLKPDNPNKFSSYLLDKKYASQDGYQILIEQSSEPDQFRFRTLLGFGNSSKTFYSNVVDIKKGIWNHFAFTYDGNGKGSFLLNGLPVGHSHYPNHGSISAGNLPLSIGDRIGSNYNAFHGFLDQIRFSRGVLNYQILKIELDQQRTAFERMEKVPEIKFRLLNQSHQPAPELQTEIVIDNHSFKQFPLNSLKAGEHADFSYNIPTDLKPGDYQSVIRVKQKGVNGNLVDLSIPFKILRRKLPHQMPVVMWGIGGIDGVVQQFPKLKQIGFTHFLGLNLDYNKIWKEGKPILAINDHTRKKAEKLLDEAYKNELGIILSIAPHRILESDQKYLRLNRDGKTYKRNNINGLFPEIQKYYFNTGASASLTYGQYPAFSGALIESEVRDGSQLSFLEIDQQAYQKATGFNIPDSATHKRGVSFTKLKDIPKNRVIPDDYPLLRFYQWFWKEGDAWNTLNSQVQAGLKTGNRNDLWSFFDPAVRVPSIYGSGGNVDYISHWTYTYPDPIRIGLCTDQLLAMAKGAKNPQQVMKMTQIIWYRSGTAPKTDLKILKGPSRWEDHEQGADFITIAPNHLREALFIKLSRAIKGIMYHGWQSLVPNESHSAYRYTNPETQHELARLIKNVVEPFGPMLLQVPEAPKKIAFLESFSSQMFANRGSYGWGGGWGADSWHVMQYAQLHPEIIYDETVIQKGLSQYELLALFDCDVLTESVVEQIKLFQKNGGMIIADNRLSPAIQADIIIKPYFRIKDAIKDHDALHKIATDLKSQLNNRFQSFVSSDNQDVLTYHRQANKTKYIFIVNNKREAGDYVGKYNRVMESGIVTKTNITIDQKSGVIYDILNGVTITPEYNDKEQIQFSLTLGPGEGRILMLTPQAVENIQISNDQSAKRGKSLLTSIQIMNTNKELFPGVIPASISIIDSNGREAEKSGHYGITNGKLDLKLDIASNDAIGIWEIRVRDLASHKIGRAFFRVE